MSKPNGRGNRVALLAIALLMPVLFAACPKNDPPPRPRASISTSPRPPNRPGPVVAGFNGERAMDHVRKQIDFGPRPPDSPQLAKTRDYISNELRSYGWQVSIDEFNTTPLGEKNGKHCRRDCRRNEDTDLIASHETKYYKDMHFVGANDPATSVATLLEIGRVLGSMKEKAEGDVPDCVL